MRPRISIRACVRPSVLPWVMLLLEMHVKALSAQFYHCLSMHKPFLCLFNAIRTHHWPLGLVLCNVWNSEIPSSSISRTWNIISLIFSAAHLINYLFRCNATFLTVLNLYFYLRLQNSTTLRLAVVSHKKKSRNFKNSWNFLCTHELLLNYDGYWLALKRSDEHEEWLEPGEILVKLRRQGNYNLKSTCS